MRRVSPITRLLAYGQGLCILVGSDATVPMQCHARSCIVECPMWESTCTLSDTDARVACCVHPARDILRADSRGSHGSSVAACCTDHQPQYQLYYAASCTDCGCRIGGGILMCEFRHAMSDTHYAGEECCYTSSSACAIASV